MITKFIERFEAKKSVLRESFREDVPLDYKALVKRVVSVLTDEEYDSIDPERIHEIDDGDYQGTLVFAIGAKGYQPSRYWYVKVSYGSCSGCDTLQAIHAYSDVPLTDGQLDDFMTLALHVVQGLKLMQEE